SRTNFPHHDRLYGIDFDRSKQLASAAEALSGEVVLDAAKLICKWRGAEEHDTQALHILEQVAYRKGNTMGNFELLLWILEQVNEREGISCWYPERHAFKIFTKEEQMIRLTKQGTRRH